MKYLIFCCILILPACKKCVKYENGKIISIVKYGKHGRVKVEYETFTDIVHKRRPNQSHIGKLMCKCVQYEK